MYTGNVQLNCSKFNLLHNVSKIKIILEVLIMNNQPLVSSLKADESIPVKAKGLIFWMIFFGLISIVIGYFCNYMNPITNLLFLGGYFPWVGLAIIAVLESLLVSYFFFKKYQFKPKITIFIMLLATLFGFLVLPGIKEYFSFLVNKSSEKTFSQQNYDSNKNNLIFKTKNQIMDLQSDGDNILWTASYYNNNGNQKGKNLYLAKLNKINNQITVQTLTDIGYDSDLAYTDIKNGKIFWYKAWGDLYYYDINLKENVQVSHGLDIYRNEGCLNEYCYMKLNGLGYIRFNIYTQELSTQSDSDPLPAGVQRIIGREPDISSQNLILNTSSSDYVNKITDKSINGSLTVYGVSMIKNGYVYYYAIFLGPSLP